MVNTIPARSHWRAAAWKRLSTCRGRLPLQWEVPRGSRARARGSWNLDAREVRRERFERVSEGRVLSDARARMSAGNQRSRKRPLPVPSRRTRFTGFGTHSQVAKAQARRIDLRFLGDACGKTRALRIGMPGDSGRWPTLRSGLRRFLSECSASASSPRTGAGGRVTQGTAPLLPAVQAYNCPSTGVGFCRL